MSHNPLTRSAIEFRAEFLLKSQDILAIRIRVFQKFADSRQQLFFRIDVAHTARLKHVLIVRKMFEALNALAEGPFLIPIKINVDDGLEKSARLYIHARVRAYDDIGVVQKIHKVNQTVNRGVPAISPMRKDSLRLNPVNINIRLFFKPIEFCMLLRYCRIGTNE